MNLNVSFKNNYMKTKKLCEHEAADLLVADITK